MRNQILALAVLILCSKGFAMAQENPPQSAYRFLSGGLASFFKDDSAAYGTGSLVYTPKLKVGLFLGAATSPQNATLKFKTTSSDISGQTSRTLDLDISGILLGLTVRYSPNNRVVFRVEAFDLVPYTELSKSMTVWQNRGPTAEQYVSHFHWDGVLGEALLRLRGGLFLIGGLRYEAFRDRLTATSPISVQTGANEGSVILNTFNLYGGFEYNEILPYSGMLTVRVAGSPGIYGHLDYDMTLRNPGEPILPIQYNSSGSTYRGSFGEISLRGTVGLGNMQLGLFTGVKAVNLKNTQDMQASSNSFVKVSLPAEMEFSRTMLEAGAYAAFSF